MKATGIVRRIDDLGRVVIPKEIRRTMRIREGDPLEIFTDSEGEVIFRKYSLMGEITSLAGVYSEVINKVTGFPVAVCDCDKVVALSGMPKKEFADRKISGALDELIKLRRNYIYEAGKRELYPVEGHTQEALCAYPVITSGDVVGAVVIFEKDAGKTEKQVAAKLAESAALIIGKHLED